MGAWDHDPEGAGRRAAPALSPADPYQRTDYRPGELAQWDLWEPPVDIPVGYGHAGASR